MYKCKECGTEYKEKPDYCDCGNDEFEVVNQESLIKDENQTKSSQLSEVAETSEKEAEIEKNIEKPNVQPASSMNFYNSESHIQKRTISIDPISLIIFIICILLSIYVIFFAWNVTYVNDKDISTKNEKAMENKTIPSIDKIWNNAIPIAKKEEPAKEKKVENIIKPVIPTQTTKKTETPKVNITKVPIKKTTATQKITPVTKSVSVNTAKSQTNTNAKEQAKMAAEASAKQKAEQERKAAEEAQIKKLREEQAKKTALAKKELAAYKANLRNAIGQKIDFTHVIGDGSCTVSFQITSNGKLTNRSFTKQSSNNTLNDAVYAAVMATPVYNPPPSAYNNEILSLNIKFYNGSFEISLP